jgi:hypothetical protein
MKIKFVLFAIALFAGCADSSFTRSADNDIKIPKTGHRFGEITAYPPVSRVNSPGWMMRARKGDKWGYVDSLRGDILIPFVFDFADDLVDNGFSRQYARVLRNGKWGFINRTGETVIPFVYDHAEQFTHNKGDFLARVSRGGRTFMISTSGMETRPSLWCELISRSDFWIGTRSNKLLKVSCDGKFGFAFDLRRERSPLDRFYHSETLKMVVPAMYSRAGDFIPLTVNGNKIYLARVQLEGYGFINDKGEAVIPPIYDSIELLKAMPPGSENYIARAELRKKFGFVNEKGEKVIPFIYESAGSFHEKVFVVKDSVAVQQDGKWGYVDYTGKITVPIVYDFIHPFPQFEIKGNETHIIKVRRGGKWGGIDPFGNEVIPVVYDRIHSFQRVETVGREILVARVAIGKKQGVTDNTGKLIIPLEYEQIGSFQTLSAEESKTAIAMVKRNGKWGFIDTNGKIIIPFKYDEVDEFHQRGMRKIARVKSGGKWIYIDDSDREIRHTVHFGSESTGNK